MTDADEVPTEPDGDRPALVRRLTRENADVAVFEFDGAARDALVASFRNNYLSTGRYAEGARAMSRQSAMSMVAIGSSGAATALSAAVAPTLFVATTNPANLMKLAGGGVGSAVMGPGGIVGQAPFIPIAATLPTVAPILAVQALTTTIILREFERIDEKLDAIKDLLGTVIARDEATHAGQLLAASATVDEINRQYEESGSFSTDMLVRLGLAEQTVRSLTERYRYLVDTLSNLSATDVDAVRRANHDANSAMLTSFVDLRIAHLRVCVDLQENPRSIEASIENLKTRITGDLKLWDQLIHRSENLREMIKTRKDGLEQMSFINRKRPGGEKARTETELAELNTAYTTTLQNEKEILEGFGSLIDATSATLDQLEEPTPEPDTTPALVYWHDESGEHAFHVEDLRLGPA